MELEEPRFQSPVEELQYWKQLAHRLYEEKESVQKEFDDYTMDSQQLEKEYETTIDQHEKTIKELRTMNSKFQNEVENLRLKLEQSNRESTSLQCDVNNVREKNDDLTKYIRELEQKNDDLERAQRVVSETVAAIEASLNNALERNAMLESEVDEKDCLKEKLQRLADEAKELKQELHVREKDKLPNNEKLLNGHSIDSNLIKVENETQTTPLRRTTNLNPLDSPLSPASRIRAVNLVGELLRKVGNMEYKLGQCRNCCRGNYTSDHVRVRQTRRGASPSLQSCTK